MNNLLWDYTTEEGGDWQRISILPDSYPCEDSEELAVKLPELIEVHTVHSLRALDKDTNETIFRWDKVSGVTLDLFPDRLGLKFDADKRDYTLLPWGALEEVVKVLEVGEVKYARDNWQQVAGGAFRYTKAAFRHLIAYASGEQNDPETGLHHLAHACCCCLFIIHFDKK